MTTSQLLFFIIVGAFVLTALLPFFKACLNDYRRMVNYRRYKRAVAKRFAEEYQRGNFMLLPDPALIEKIDWSSDTLKVSLLSDPIKPSYRLQDSLIFEVPTSNYASFDAADAVWSPPSFRPKHLAILPDDPRDQPLLIDLPEITWTQPEPLELHLPPRQ